MRKSLAVLIAVIIAAMLCGCADDVSSSVQQADSSSRSSTKWTVTKVADDDISCEGLVLTALNSGDFPEMVKATDSTLLDTIMDFSKYGITDYCVYQQAISVELSEIIAVRADDTDGVKAALQSRKDSLIKQRESKTRIRRSFSGRRCLSQSVRGRQGQSRYWTLWRSFAERINATMTE